MKLREAKVRCPLCSGRVGRSGFREHVAAECAEAKDAKDSGPPAKRPRLPSSDAQTSTPSSEAQTPAGEVAEERFAVSLKLEAPSEPRPPRGRSSSVLGLEPVARRLFRAFQRAARQSLLCQLSKAFGATYAMPRRLCSVATLSKPLPSTFKRDAHPKVCALSVSKGRVRQPLAWAHLRHLTLTKVPAEHLQTLLLLNGPTLRKLCLGAVTGKLHCLDDLVATCPKLARLRSLRLSFDANSDSTKVLALAPDTLERLDIRWLSNFTSIVSVTKMDWEVLAMRVLELLERCTALRSLALPRAACFGIDGSSALGPKVAEALAGLTALQSLSCSLKDQPSQLPVASVRSLRLCLFSQSLPPLPDLSSMGPQLSSLSLDVIGSSLSGVNLAEWLEPVERLGGLEHLALSVPPNSSGSWWLGWWTGLRKLRLRSFALRLATRKADYSVVNLHLNPEMLESLALEIYPHQASKEIGQAEALSLVGESFPRLGRLELRGRPATFASLAAPCSRLFPALRSARWEGGAQSVRGSSETVSCRVLRRLSRTHFAGPAAAAELGRHLERLTALAERAKGLLDLAVDGLHGVRSSLRLVYDDV